MLASRWTYTLVRRSMKVWCKYRPCRAAGTTGIRVWAKSGVSSHSHQKSRGSIPAPMYTSSRLCIGYRKIYGRIYRQISPAGTWKVDIDLWSMWRLIEGWNVSTSHRRAKLLGVARFRVWDICTGCWKRKDSQEKNKHTRKRTPDRSPII